LETRVCSVTTFEALNQDVYRVRLRLVAKETRSIHFHAGQYLDLLLPDGKKSSFSIASAPDQGRELELHIRRVAGSELNAMVLGYLQAKPQVEVELPKGDVHLSMAEIEPETHFVFVAASTGFAQVKSMVEHLLANQASNRIDIYWGARREADLYLEELPRQWAHEHANVHYVPVVSEVEESPGWSGRSGLLPEVVVEDLAVSEALVVYACGSPGMVYALLDRLKERGVAEAQIHSDVFAWAPRSA